MGKLKAACANIRPATMRTLAQVVAASRKAFPSVCEGCQRRQTKPLGFRTSVDVLGDDDRLAMYQAPHTIVWDPIVLCDRCFEDCRPIYEIAKRRVLIASADATVSFQLTSQRIAYLRALPTMARGGRYQGACLWCGMKSAEATSFLEHTGDRADRPITTQLIPLSIHDHCAWAANRAVHNEWIDQCTDSQALLLPLWPEVCRHIGWFVCRLSGVNVESAAANRCSPAEV